MSAAQQPEGSIIDRMLVEILGEHPSTDVSVVGAGSLPSVFPVNELATASIAAAGVAVQEYRVAAGADSGRVTVDRRLASMWFASSLRPVGWQVPPPWDALAGDYRTADGWIRLHTNAPHHRDAALAVLNTPAEREQVSAATAGWAGAELEATIIAAGGCAATMQTMEQWDRSEPGRVVAAEPLIRRETGVAVPGERRRALAERVLAEPRRPLAGIRVLDLTRVLAGPVATRFLAQLGATVLRIDPPWWDEPGVVPEVMLGKRSAGLDLREPAARERFASLLAEADILVHGYRPGALDGLGLGEAVRAQLNPGLIDVNLDAYGWAGPWVGRRGFDSLVQMSTGIADAGMRIQGTGRPTPLPVQALDHATGYLMALAAIRALTTRMRTGRAGRARLSLARTARMLTSFGTQQPGTPLGAEDERDCAPAIERTSWGPARRLVPPLSVPGTDIRADLPARTLGGNTASW